MSHKFRSEKRLKQDAKKLSKEQGISHGEALDQIARENGFTSWTAFNSSIQEAASKYIVEPYQESLLDEKHQESIPFPHDEIGDRLHENKIELTSKGIDFAVFEPTETGLKKSILDATQPVRSFFFINEFHDFESQGQGSDNKIIKKAFLLTPEESIETTVSLYRPNTKKGDPRMWFSKLAKLAQPEDKVAICIYEGDLYLINLSNIELCDLIINKDSALSKFIEQYESVNESVAEELLQKLKEIAKKGPLKAIKEGSTAIGMTIEHALGIAANSSKEPDYKGIELKSARGFNKTRTNLFAQVADWDLSPLKSSREILEKFGYPRGEDFKLYCTVSALKENSQGLKFEHREVDEILVETQKDYGDVAVWRDKLLRQRLYEKHSETFWISADSTKIDGVEYFQLKSVTHTRSPLQGQLMPLIASGVITMDHLIKRKSGVKPKVAEKGPLFKINKKDLPLLFPSPKTYLLN